MRASEVLDALEVTVMTHPHIRTPSRTVGVRAPIRRKVASNARSTCQAAE